MSSAATARPAGPASRVTSGPWFEPVMLALLVAAGALITWFRVPADHRDRVWAEDANIFLHEALEQGPLTVLFQGYAGYQHLVPRLVLSGLFPALDLELYPQTVFAICAVLTGLTAAAVYWLSRDIVPWQPARLTLALVTALIPLATQETIGNLADIHTYAMWLAPWLLLYRPRTWATSAGWALVAFLIVMTEIQAVFFVFLLLFRLRRSDRRAWPVLAAFVVGSAAQLLTAVTMDRGTGNGPLSIASTVMGWMINTVMPLVTADPDTIRRWVLDHGLLVAVVILIPLVAAALIALIIGTGDQRLLTVAMLLGSAAIYTGSAWANSDTWFMYAEEGLGAIQGLIVNVRYGVASGMMLVAPVAIAADAVVRRFRARLIVRVLAGIACLGLLVVLANGSTMTLSSRDWVGRWSPAVLQAVQTCAAEAPPRTVELPVAPDRSIDITCDDILTHTGR
jgi:hypothetical protein